MSTLPRDGLVLVAKRECPTCELVVPVCAELAAAGTPLTVYTQDDPGFPKRIEGVRDDTELEISWRLGVETVPTLVRLEAGREVGRAIRANRPCPGGAHRGHLWPRRRRSRSLREIASAVPRRRARPAEATMKRSSALPVRSEIPAPGGAQPGGGRRGVAGRGVRFRRRGGGGLAGVAAGGVPTG